MMTSLEFCKEIYCRAWPIKSLENGATATIKFLWLDDDDKIYQSRIDVTYKNLANFLLNDGNTLRNSHGEIVNHILKNNIGTIKILIAFTENTHLTLKDVKTFIQYLINEVYMEYIIEVPLYEKRHIHRINMDRGYWVTEILEEIIQIGTSQSIGYRLRDVP